MFKRFLFLLIIGIYFALTIGATIFILFDLNYDPSAKNVFSMGVIFFVPITQIVLPFAYCIFLFLINCLIWPFLFIFKNKTLYSIIDKTFKLLGPIKLFKQFKSFMLRTNPTFTKIKMPKKIKEQKEIHNNDPDLNEAERELEIFLNEDQYENLGVT